MRLTGVVRRCTRGKGRAQRFVSNSDRKRRGCNTDGLLIECRTERFGMSPVRYGHRSAAILRTAGRVECSVAWVCGRVTMAMMLRRAPAAQVIGRGGGLQRKRKEYAAGCKQQQKSGNQTLHAFSCKQNPGKVSIDEPADWAQASDKLMTFGVPCFSARLGEEIQSLRARDFDVLTSSARTCRRW